MKKFFTIFLLLGTLLIVIGTSPVPVYADEAPAWLSGEKVSCGNIQNIPKKVPEFVSMFILIAQVVVPVLLVLFGMIDFAKGVMSQKEDEIKKGQQTFIKRLLVGAIVFFVVALVKMLVSIVGDTDTNKENIISCIDCFVNGVENCGGTSSGGGGGGNPDPGRNPTVDRYPTYEQI